VRSTRSESVQKSLRWIFVSVPRTRNPHVGFLYRLQEPEILILDFCIGSKNQKSLFRYSSIPAGTSWASIELQ